jgi:hypothetical protein
MGKHLKTMEYSMEHGIYNLGIIWENHGIIWE